ncbi:MAG TPA: type II toxin-antitoxin system VapC family toxin [Nitrospiraceae bacterium]|nr:type II toxin-antitoxin system VapC family toxin [Nitrospiraceae bacterium]
MRILLDTSAYSWFMRGNQEVKEVLQSADSIAVNPIVLGELHAGFQHGRHVEKNRNTLKQFLASPRVYVVAMDEETAERYAVIVNALWRIGRPIPTNDLWIAASAMQYGLTILTTDSHFKHVAQVLIHHVPLT